MTPIIPDLPQTSPDDEHNRALVENVHPLDWVNPQPTGRYNMVVIGAGTAGLVTAAGAAGLGARVALIERALMGGDCLNVGCVPSKALIRCARAAADVREAGTFGVRVPEGSTVDFPCVMQRMRRLRAGISPHDSARRFRDELGVDVYIGDGRFTGPDTIEVDGRALRFARACIATGARAAALPLPGLAETGYLTNETIFTLTELPRRLAVIGAGPIGCELAQAFARFGSSVTLLEAGPQILSREERAAAEIIQAALQRDGVAIRCGASIIAARREGGAKVLELKGGELVTADEILLGVGRAPNVEGLGLDAAGVAHERTGVRVDDRLRTSNRHIYAAGDVCSRWKFTHAADFMARTVIRNALFFGRGRLSALNIPWCTYTDPEIAGVGVTGSAVRERGDELVTITVELATVDRALLEGEEQGFVQVHATPKGRIAGATIVARHAGEMISEITLAMDAGVTLGALATTIHPYPTVAEALRKAGDAWNRRKLTPRVKGVFERVMQWRR